MVYSGSSAKEPRRRKGSEGAHACMHISFWLGLAKRSRAARPLLRRPCRRPAVAMLLYVGVLLLCSLIAMAPKLRLRAKGKPKAKARGKAKAKGQPKAAKSKARKPAPEDGTEPAAEPMAHEDEEAANAMEGLGAVKAEEEQDSGKRNRRAPRGSQVRDHEASNLMLSSLRQQSKGNDPEKAAKAAKALDVYHSMEWEEKEVMVQRHRQNKKRGSLTWIDEFMESRTKDDTTKIGWNENYRSPGQVLQLLGMSLGDFADHGKAQAFITEEVRRNQEQTGTATKYPPKIDPDNWLMSRYYWVIDEGKSRTPRAFKLPPPRPRGRGGEGEGEGRTSEGCRRDAGRTEEGWEGGGTEGPAGRSRAAKPRPIGGTRATRRRP